MISSEISSTRVRPYDIWTISLSTPTPSLITGRSSVVGRIMIRYRTRLLSRFRGLDSAIRYPLLSSIFLTPKNPEVILEIIKFGFSEVSQIPSCRSQKIPLILTIPTVSSVFSYLLWGTRNGSCRFLCLHVLSQLPLDVYGRIICRLKGIFKGNPTPSESWETVRWGQNYSKNKFDK